MPLLVPSLVLFCNNNGAMTRSKDPRNHWIGKHIKRKYYLIPEIVMTGDVAMEKIASIKNLADPFTKTLSTRIFYGHGDGLGVRCVPNMI